mgnify:CR=1 FL=1
MKKIIRCKIDVTKIDKAALFKGAKGTYLDFALVETPDGKFGDWMITQDVSKEDREAGKKGAILGNGKNWGGGGTPRSVTREDAPPAKHGGIEPDGDSDIPF